jgi:putative spermidine/putrescine transport system ATP-binding protein
VARFIGGQNVLAGRVEGVIDGRALAIIGKGARLEIPLGGFRIASGELVFASVRRDRVMVRRPAPGEARRDLLNSVEGEVHAIENQGSWVKITIDLGDDEQFVANVPEKDYFADPIEIGERAVASWQASDVRPLEDGRDARPASRAPATAVAA